MTRLLYTTVMTISESWLRRIRRPVFGWAVIALVAEVAVERALGRQSPSTRSASRQLVALLPLIPLLVFMLALVRQVQHMDELQRKICLDSVVIAFVATLTLVFVGGGLEQAGVYRPPWDEVGTAMMALWACANAYASWKYR
jgi:hypothetical protein